MPDEFHRISTAALRRRGLVETSGKGPGWRATITAIGHEYLEKVESSNPPIPRQPTVSVTQQLVDDVTTAGGLMRVPRRHWGDPDHVDYANRARIAQRLGKVPEGKRLAITYHSTELEIRLEDGPLIVRTEPKLVSVPERIGRYHQAARGFQKRSDRHEVSRNQLRRTTQILHAIATEADRRDWEVSVPNDMENRYGGNEWTATKHGHVQISAAGERLWLRIQEEGVHTRGPWEKEVGRYRNARDDDPWWRDRKIPRGAYDADATGRLQIVLHAGRHWILRGRQHRFGDRQSWTLETRLTHLFQEIEERIVEFERYDEEKRIEVEREAEAARVAAEERERRWHQLMAEARERLLYEHRAAHASGQVDAWRRATDLRQYCDAIEASHGLESASAEWISWMRDYSDRIDPLVRAPTLPDPPEETADALQKYLPAGWCADGPEADTRHPYRPRW